MYRYKCFLFHQGTNVKKSYIIVTICILPTWIHCDKTETIHQKTTVVVGGYSTKVPPISFLMGRARPHTKHQYERVSSDRKYADYRQRTIPFLKPLALSCTACYIPRVLTWVVFNESLWLWPRAPPLPTVCRRPYSVLAPQNTVSPRKVRPKDRKIEILIDTLRPLKKIEKEKRPGHTAVRTQNNLQEIRRAVVVSLHVFFFPPQI